MSILDTLLGRPPSLDEAEEELGQPGAEEAVDLPLHVARCGKRWKLSYRLSQTNNAQLTQLRLILLVIFVYLVATNPNFLKVFG